MPSMTHPHLPRVPISLDEYNELYTLVFEELDCDDEYPLGTSISLDPSCSEVDVYRKLPSSPRIEYGGYITAESIQYWEGDAESVNIEQNKLCTWHSHPVTHPWADLPSWTDLHRFLRYPNVRHILVGNRLLWVMDKDEAAVAYCRRLLEWEAANLVNTFSSILDTAKDRDARSDDVWDEATQMYAITALREIGWDSVEDWPDQLERNPLSSSVSLLREQLGIAVRLYLRLSHTRGTNLK